MTSMKDMIISKSLRTLPAQLLVLIILGCSGHSVGRQVSTFDDIREKYDVSDNVDKPVKVFRIDGSIFLFRDGIHYSKSALWGVADILTPDGEVDTAVTTTIEASEIAGATLFEFDENAVGTVGMVVVGAIYAIPVAVAISCIGNPKCFGSCPTVYVPKGDSMEMVAEMFSTSISPSLALDDLDRLSTAIGDSAIPVDITNEALESHYIDRVEFVYVPHAQDEVAVPQPDGSIKIIGSTDLDLRVLTSEGTDISSILQHSDEVSWRSQPKRLLTIPSEDPFDHLIVTVNAPHNDEIDLMIRWKNTLLSTVLLYQMVLGDQGLSALSWQERLDTDPVYSAAFSMIYDHYSGIRFEVWNGAAWEALPRMRDAGPIVWRQESITIPTHGQETVKIRLSGLADNLEIDHISARSPIQTTVSEIPLTTDVIASTAADTRIIIDLLGTADDRYLQHEPGGSTSLLVHLPKGAVYGSLFVRSHGWYYEWIRNGWLTSSGPSRPVDLLNGEQMVRELGKRWMDEHADLEESFHRITIPLRKP